MRSPNIVLIMADQLAPQATEAYGFARAKTPNMKDLAERGARFDFAYTNAPLCAPARFSFMAGQHVTRIAAYDNASEFPASIPTFAHYLGAMGYRTCLSGKMHFVGPDQLHGFHERLTTDIYPSDYAWTPDWEASDERIDKWYHNMDQVREAGVAATTFQIEYDEEVGFFAQRKIFDYARDDDDRPFMMVISFIHPHDPYVALKKWWDLYEDDPIAPPSIGKDDVAMDPHAKRLYEGIEADKAGDISAEQVAIARRAYFANTSYFDHWVGRIRDTLEEAQLIDDTVMMVTADHGDMLGERGLWYKMNFFEWSARVPMIVAGPGVAAGEVRKEPASLVDVLPTMLDLAARDGRAKPELGQPIDGRSLASALEGGPAHPEAEAIGEYCAEMASHPIFMIRRGAYKYVHCDVDPPQLYDLENDPDERVNLADDPAHADTVERFRAEVARRWDSAKIRDDVVRTQRARRAVHAAMQRGPLTSWDYQPKRDAAQEYVRNHMDWTVAAAKTRFPPLGS